MVAVELASVPVEAGDVIAIIPSLLDADEERKVQTLLEMGGREARELAELLYGESGKTPFVGILEIGPEAIYLNQVADETGDSHPAQL